MQSGFMRRGCTHYVLALAFVIALVAQSDLSHAQETVRATDFRGRSAYSAEDLAQALFPQAAPALQTRSIGPQQVRPSLPTPNPRAVVTLNVTFGTNSDTIPSTSYTEIDKLGTILSWPQYTDYRIQLEGHTDSQGSARKNQMLSEKRVQSMKEYLVQHFHIAPERVRAVGYGASKPIASNDTQEGRSQNRRVEVVNLGQ